MPRSTSPPPMDARRGGGSQHPTQRLAPWNGCDLLVQPPDDVFASRFSSRPPKQPLLPRIHRITAAATQTDVRSVVSAAATSLRQATIGRATGLAPSGGVAMPQDALPHNPLPNVHVFSTLVAALRGVLSTLCLKPKVGEVVLLPGCHDAVVDLVTKEFQLVVRWAPVHLFRSMLRRGQPLSVEPAATAAAPSPGTATVDMAALRAHITPNTGLVFLGGHVVLDCGVPWSSYVEGKNGGKTNWWNELGTLQEETGIPCAVEISDLGEALSAIMVRGPPTEAMLATSGPPRGNGGTKPTATKDSTNDMTWVLRDKKNPLARVPMLLLNTTSAAPKHSGECLGGGGRGAVVALAPVRLGVREEQPRSWRVARELSALWRRLWGLFVDDPLSVGIVFTFFATLHTIGVPTMLRRGAGSYNLSMVFLRRLGNKHDDGRTTTSISPPRLSAIDATLSVQGAATMNSNQQHRDGVVGKLRTRWMACIWQFVNRLPPYVEVLSASDPQAPQQATFCSHGVVLLVRKPSVVVETLQRNGFEARLVCGPLPDRGGGNNAQRASVRSNELPNLFVRHALRIAVGSDMAPSALRRLLLVVWGIQASDLASPYFDPNPPRRRPPGQADGCGETQKKTKKSSGALPSVYDTAEVRAFCDGYPVDTVCHEPMSPLLVSTLGLAGVALSKL